MSCTGKRKDTDSLIQSEAENEFFYISYYLRAALIDFKYYLPVPLYLFAPLEDHGIHPTDCGDSGVVSSSHSTTDPRTSSISR
uniref:Ovule protein n=1 Tax=Heterorhabditis bacteriophora TaxID=37862 RepID=A0A1I7W9V3_HETBA